MGSDSSPYAYDLQAQPTYKSQHASSLDVHGNSVSPIILDNLWPHRTSCASCLVAPRSVPGGSDDIAYGGGNFLLDDDQAMIIEVVPPKARNWSFQYYTYGWFESPDVANRQTSLNNAQTYVDADGKVRIVVSRQDPGVQNWMDTEGRHSASLSYRWIWTEDKPAPTGKVVPFAEVRAHLPQETPEFSLEERREQVRVRREHLERRFHR